MVLALSTPRHRSENMSVDKWIERAKKNGILKEEKEVKNMGSSPMKKEPRDILPKPRKQRKGEWRGARNALDQFLEMCPLVKRWLTPKRTRSARESYGWPFLTFCIEANIMPKDFGELYHTHKEVIEARDLVWSVCVSFMEQDRNHYALAIRKVCKAFYRWYTKADAELPFDSTPGGFHYIPSGKERAAYDWGTVEESKELFSNILNFAPDLMYRTICMLDFVTGWRANVYESLKWKHFATPGIKNINGEEVLIVKITKDEDDKQAKALKYYWSFIRGEALAVFRSYEKFHKGDKGLEDPVFYYLQGTSKGEPLRSIQCNKTWKRMVRTAEKQGVIP